MADDIRCQRKCFYASSDYSASFWGRFIYLYQGKGRLRLTTSSLCLEDCPGAVAIPFDAVKSIGLGRFSSWAKPLGLSRLVVNYTRDGEPTTLHLIPYESVWDPTPATSELVSSWHQTLGRVEGLASRVESPRFDPTATGPTGKGRVAVALLVLAPIAIPIAILTLVGWLFGHF